MNFTTKRKHKKLAGVFHTLGYIFIILFALELFTMMGYGIAIDGELTFLDGISPWILVLTFGLPVASSITFGILGAYHANQRYQFLNNIKRYRNYSNFQKCLSALINEEFDKVGDYYLAMYRGELKDYLWAFGVASFFKSKDEKWKKKGLELINNYREDYMPSKVHF